jgi:hypothetical protein
MIAFLYGRLAHEHAAARECGVHAWRGTFIKFTRTTLHQKSVSTASFTMVRVASFATSKTYWPSLLD